jgi:uncharacterized membrane protein
LRKTNYNFIKIDLNFPATLASPSFELATLGIESKTLRVGSSTSGFFSGDSITFAEALSKTTSVIYQLHNRLWIDSRTRTDGGKEMKLVMTNYMCNDEQ